MSRTIDPSRFDRWVDVQAPVTKRDAHGGDVQAYVSCCPGAGWWAEIEPLSGRLQIEGAGLEARQTHTIRMRYFRGLGPSHRVVWTEPDTGLQHVFAIQGTPVIFGQRNEFHVLYVEEVAPDPAVTT